MIRRVKRDDRESLKDILESTPNFTSDEVSVAMELIDVTINFPEQKDYNIFVLEQGENLCGYHCTGKRALTDGVYDLYWIVVDARKAEKGSGKLLLDHAEAFVKEQNGRWLLAETSSKSLYEKTRSFYERNDYRIIARIEDFYSAGDALCIYGKRFVS